MEKIVTSFGIAFAALAVLFFAIILGPLIGGISGWIVGLFFGETFLAILAQIGIHGFTMFQIGAFLGFVGGFFKSSLSYNKSKE